MKPRTKLQKEVNAASQLLKPLTEKQEKWAYKHCLQHVAYKTKHKFSCLDCGHEWSVEKMPISNKKKTCVCPECNTKLNIKETRKKSFEECEYLGMTQQCGKFQVLRIFIVRKFVKVGKRYDQYISEVVQRWISPNGEIINRAKLRLFSVIYHDVWDYSSPLEIRGREAQAYLINPFYILPNASCTSTFKRNGFKGKFHGIEPVKFFTTILKNSMAETLLKAGQYKMLDYFIHNSKKVEEYWSSIKICIRKKYFIKDGSIWIDYLELLKYFGKDLHSSKYLCPANLGEEHDKLLLKKSDIEHKEEVDKENISYVKAKSNFFDIQFANKNIEVVVLRSVQDFIYEGQKLHHCVFTNKYYQRENSLILSARINGLPVETIEVSLSTLEIVQSRGSFNKPTIYHNEILNLIKKNMFQIRKRLSA